MSGARELFQERRHAMKIYEGERGLSGAVATVDGRPLPPKTEVKLFSKTGFEWTYPGPGPQQLALALLADHLDDDRRALDLCSAFMREVVAHLDNAWRLDSSDIDAAIAKIEQITL